MGLATHRRCVLDSTHLRCVADRQNQESLMAIDPIHNGKLLEEYERKWREDPRALDPEWQAFFQGFELGNRGLDRSFTDAQIGVLRLLFAHRDLGHRSAYLNA